MRRYGEPPLKDQIYTPRPGAYGVLAYQGRVLLTHQILPKAEVQLPGGGIDPGESPIQALHRECLEETGWRVNIVTRLGAYQRYTFMPDYELWAQKICHIYLCVPTMKRAEPTEPHHRNLWVSPDEAYEVLSSDGDRDFLETALLRR
ncbi:MAG: NUDIX hydrolase [Rhodobacteraceae bacterium]|nr:MAG: NUDIX hydrolase [Paracoccaceae bacterium]